MLIHVLYSQKTYVTGRALVKELHTVMNILRLGTVRGVQIRGGQGITTTPDLLIRWGNSEHIGYTPRLEFNPAEALRKTSNKVTMVKAFRAHGTPSPRIWTHDEFRYINWPVIVRTFNHFKGKGFYEVSNHLQLMGYANPQHYACEIIDVQEEFRVFVFDGKVMEINKKMQEGIVAHQRNAKIRNHENGWINRRGGFDIPEGVRSVAKSAAEAVGLTFGACDVYIDAHGRAGVFEINSAPGLADRKLRKLALKIVSKYYGPISEEQYEQAMAGLVND